MYSIGRYRSVRASAAILGLKFSLWEHRVPGNAGTRRMFYYPDKLDQSAFAVYRLRTFNRFDASLQLNVTNLFDQQAHVTLPNPTTGAPRYFSEWYTPRKFALSAAFSL